MGTILTGTYWMHTPAEVAVLFRRHRIGDDDPRGLFLGDHAIVRAFHALQPTGDGLVLRAGELEFVREHHAQRKGGYFRRPATSTLAVFAPLFDVLQASMAERALRGDSAAEEPVPVPYAKVFRIDRSKL